MRKLGTAQGVEFKCFAQTHFWRKLNLRMKLLLYDFDWQLDYYFFIANRLRFCSLYLGTSNKQATVSIVVKRWQPPLPPFLPPPLSSTTTITARIRNGETLRLWRWVLYHPAMPGPITTGGKNDNPLLISFVIGVPETKFSSRQQLLRQDFLTFLNKS